MELKHYVRVLRVHRLLVVASVVVCTSAAGFLAWSRTPTYAARTTLFVSTSGISADPSQAYQGGLFAEQRVLSYAQIVSSPAVVRAVIRQLNLRESVQQLQSRIDASVPTNTVLINVTVRNRSPGWAKAIADALSAQFISFVNTLEKPGPGRSSPVKVSVTSQAHLPTHPVSPRKPVYLGVGVLLGLVLGISAALLREVTDRRIRGADDAFEITGAPVLGSIADDPRARKRPLIVVHDPLSVRAEAYRRVRTNLAAVSNDHRLGSFVVSSAVESEGKTLVVANLGVAFAQAGYRVVLVDADLRRPRLGEVLGVHSTKGLANVLVDGMPVQDALQRLGTHPQLEVLASGPKPPNPSELLGSERLISLVHTLNDRADLVILDAPALLRASDAAILARVTSGVILVTRLASTRADQLQTAAESLHAVDANVLGIVLNRSPVRAVSPRGSSQYAPRKGISGDGQLGTDVPMRVPTDSGA
jgi:non-specific protein-tyrosine kinase